MRSRPHVYSPAVTILTIISMALLLTTSGCLDPIVSDTPESACELGPVVSCPCLVGPAGSKTCRDDGTYGVCSCQLKSDKICDPGARRCSGQTVEACTSLGRGWITEETCESPSSCIDGACVCVPECGDRQCGDDGCGGSCGSCDDGDACTDDFCSIDGRCVSPPSQDAACVEACLGGPRPCDDGNACTTADACDDGNACVGSSPWETLLGKGRSTNDVAVTIHGNVMVTGSSDSYAWVTKLNPTGEVIWDRTYGEDSEHSYFHALTPTSDGGAVLVGQIYSWDTWSDVGWMVRVDSEGDVLWERTPPVPQWKVLYDVVEDPDGSFVAVGYHDEEGVGLTWLLRVDGHGEQFWDGVYGDDEEIDGYGQGQRIVAVEDGYVIAGRKNVQDVGTDAWLLKVGQDGEVLWERTYGGDLEDTFRPIVPLPNGGFLVGGKSDSLGDGWWLVWTDEDGEETDSQLYADDGIASVADLAVTGDGSAWVVADNELFRVDQEGQLELEIGTDWSYPQNARRVVVLEDGGAAVVGWGEDGSVLDVDGTAHGRVFTVSSGYPDCQ